MKKLFEFLIANKITPNGFFTLFTLSQQLGYTGYIRSDLEINKLEKELFVKKNDITQRYEVTSKGIVLLKEAERLMSRVKKTIVTKEWDEKIVQYNELFPKGKRNDSTVGYRRNPKELKDTFIWFFDKYSEYNWDDVLEITKKYIDSFGDDYTYLQNAKYFIKKSDVNKTISSTLADLIYNVREGNDITINDDGVQYYGEN